MDQAEHFLQVAILNLLFLFYLFNKNTLSETREMRVWKYLLKPCPLRVECKMISNSIYADGPSSFKWFVC